MLRVLYNVSAPATMLLQLTLQDKALESVIKLT